MAIIKLQSPIAELRGTVGGITYSINQSNRYAKSWRQPVYKRTDKQSVSRVNFADSTVRWRALTNDQRSAWAALAADPPEPDYDRFGTLIYLTGLQWFTRCNTRLAQVGTDLIEDAPTGDRPAAVTDLQLAVDYTPVGGNKLVTFTSYEVLTGWAILTFGALTRGDSRTAFQHSFKFVRSDLSGGTITQQPFTTEWTALFPLGAPGWKAWAMTYIQDDYGLRSQVASSSAICT